MIQIILLKYFLNEIFVELLLILHENMCFSMKIPVFGCFENLNLFSVFVIWLNLV